MDACVCVCVLQFDILYKSVYNCFQVSDRDALAVRMDFQAFVRKVVVHILQKAPCKYSLVRNLACLNPRNMVAHPGNLAYFWMIRPEI